MIMAAASISERIARSIYKDNSIPGRVPIGPGKQRQIRRLFLGKSRRRGQARHIPGSDPQQSGAGFVASPGGDPSGPPAGQSGFFSAL